MGFERFFREFYPKIVKLLMYAGASLENAEDAAAEAMAQAYLRWQNLADPPAWVRVVALRLYIKADMRNQKRRQLEAAAAYSAYSGGERQGEPDEEMRVREALRTLPQVQRKVMALTFDGCESAEIAKLLDKREETVRSNLRHARNRLRRKLQGSAGDDDQE